MRIVLLILAVYGILALAGGIIVHRELSNVHTVNVEE